MPMPAEEADARSVRIALCEPAADLRGALRARLDADGGEPPLAVVAEAGDGEEGVRVVAATQPDVAIVELWMPRLDGTDAIPQMLAAAQDTRIILFTAATTPNMRRLCGSLGAHAFVDKRATSDALVEQVRALAA
jgi:DNA-binding NarL/FixJ family response regulator